MAAEAAACLAMEEVWAALAAAEAAVGEAERGTAGEEVAGEMKGGLKLETALRAAHAPAISRGVCVCTCPCYNRSHSRYHTQRLSTSTQVMSLATLTTPTCPHPHPCVPRTAVPVYNRETT